MAIDHSDYSDYSTLAITCEGRVATVALNRPESLNAVSDDMHHELSRVFHQLADDKEVGVVVLTGKGKAFSAGGDIPWMEEMAAKLPFHLDNLRVAQRIIMGILECPKPIVCRMNGDAIGLGASIALVCDMIIAVDTARIADPHVKIGLVAGDGGALIWPQLIGYAKAKEFLLTGSAVAAPEAARMGLINSAVKAEDLDAAVQKHVGKLLAVSPSAAAYTKLAVNLPLRQAVHSVLELSSAFEGLSMLQNADWKEGIAAFKQGRAPKYPKD
jgi:enoyl-CoA hydratase